MVPGLQSLIRRLSDPSYIGVCIVSTAFLCEIQTARHRISLSKSTCWYSRCICLLLLGLLDFCSLSLFKKFLDNVNFEDIQSSYRPSCVIIIIISCRIWVFLHCVGGDVKHCSINQSMSVFTLGYAVILGQLSVLLIVFLWSEHFFFTCSYSCFVLSLRVSGIKMMMMMGIDIRYVPSPLVTPYYCRLGNFLCFVFMFPF